MTADAAAAVHHVARNLAVPQGGAQGDRAPLPIAAPTATADIYVEGGVDEPAEPVVYDVQDARSCLC